MADNPSNGRMGKAGGIEATRREIFADGKRVEAFVRDALRDVRILHKKMGVPLVGWQNGKLVSIPPEEIQIDLPAADNSESG